MNLTESQQGVNVAAPAACADDRPGIAFIAPQQTPYRVHFALRMYREVPQVKFWSVFTHEFAVNRWKIDSPPEVNYVQFGAGEFCENQDKPAYALREWRRGGRIIRWMDQNNIRAVVVLGYNDPARLRVIRWARRRKIPLFLWGDSNIRGDLARGAKAIAKRLFVRWIIRQLDACLACGSLGRQYFEKYGAAPEKIYYMPVEPDYDLIASVPADRIEQILQQYNWSRQRRRMVFSARITRVKRPDLMIDAFCEIASRRENWDLVMLGTGDLASQMQARVPEELRRRVTFTGFVDGQEKVSAIYRCCDLLVLPSDYEPWALVVNEAAAAGLALVTSDVVGASPELVREGVNGFTFPVGNRAALVETLLRVTQEPTIDRFKAASPQVLAEWRRTGDPVAGLRQALVDHGVLPK
ncbi:MAG: glycosyltransferase family 4 protein [Phycisphaerae bacterium]|nr:glycosyltransferase family 4 protein [Phycisphaerae bacterium]